MGSGTATKGLRRAGVALGVMAVLLAGCDFLHRPTIEEQADKIPSLKALHDYYPQEYQQVIAMLKASKLDASNKVAVQDHIRPVIAQLMAKQAPHMSEENAIATFHLAVDEAKTLKARSAEDCVNFLNGGGRFGFAADEVFTKEELERDTTLTAKLLAQTAVSPLPTAAPLSSEQRAKLARAAVDTLPAASRETLMPILQYGGTPVGAAQQGAYCDFTIAILQQLLAMPPKESGPMFRALAASK